MMSLSTYSLLQEKGVGPGDFEDVFVVSVHWAGVPNVSKVEIMGNKVCSLGWKF